MPNPVTAAKPNGGVPFPTYYTLNTNNILLLLLVHYIDNEIIVFSTLSSVPIFKIANGLRLTEDSNNFRKIDHVTLIMCYTLTTKTALGV